jgi:hypothetical protein
MLYVYTNVQYIHVLAIFNYEYFSINRYGAFNKINNNNNDNDLTIYCHY